MKSINEMREELEQDPLPEVPYRDKEDLAAYDKEWGSGLPPMTRPVTQNGADPLGYEFILGYFVGLGIGFFLGMLICGAI